MGRFGDSARVGDFLNMKNGKLGRSREVVMSAYFESVLPVAGVVHRIHQMHGERPVASTLSRDQRLRVSLRLQWKLRKTFEVLTRDSLVDLPRDNRLVRPICHAYDEATRVRMIMI
jgi:hypothetical protein